MLANALAEAGRGVEAAPLFMEAAEQATPADALESRRRAAEQWLFTGRIERGLEVLNTVFRELRMTFARGVALAQAAKSDDSKARKRALREASRHQSGLEAERTAWGNALSIYVGAQLALFQDRRDQAEEQFERAAKALEDQGMLAFAAAVSYRLGRMRTDDAGVALVERARAFMRAQGVRAPDRFLEMLAPGL